MDEDSGKGGKGGKEHQDCWFLMGAQGSEGVRCGLGGLHGPHAGGHVEDTGSLLVYRRKGCVPLLFVCTDEIEEL